jgi:hypothetical protein
MLERAVRILEKQALDIYQYKDIIEDFEQYVTENPEKFDSAHEMIAAMMLVEMCRAIFAMPETKGRAIDQA